MNELTTIVSTLLRRGVSKMQLEAYMKPYDKFDPNIDHQIKRIAKTLAYHLRMHSNGNIVHLINGIKMLHDLYPLKFNYEFKDALYYKYDVKTLESIQIKTTYCNIMTLSLEEEIRQLIIYKRRIFLYIASDKNTNKHPIISNLPSELVRLIASEWI